MRFSGSVARECDRIGTNATKTAIYTRRAGKSDDGKSGCPPPQRLNFNASETRVKMEERLKTFPGASFLFYANRLAAGLVFF
jgi:hypothetical protein